jgi:hypothetical protein
MVATRFKAGERVRLRAAIPDVRAGTVGTIQFVLHSVDDICDVQFDGHARPQLMRARELEHTNDPPPALPWAA